MSIKDRPTRFPWPPLIFVALIATGYGLGYLLPLPWALEPTSGLLSFFGVFFIGGAILLDIATAYTLWHHHTTIWPNRGVDHLVTNGPFAISRNPIYLGYVVILIGLGLFFGNLWYFALAPLCGFLLQKAAIRHEEAHLHARFPVAYLAYRKKVRRWL